MNIKNAFKLLFGFILFIILSVLVTGYFLFQNQEKLVQSEIIKDKLLAIAAELRNSSDDLTNYCRLFVMTGDTAWEAKYWRSLDIRNGKYPHPNGKLISLRDSLRKLRLTKNEFELLSLSEDRANELIWTEQIAFNAMRGIFLDSAKHFTVHAKPNVALAQQIMFGEEYLLDKKHIMQTIDEFIEQVNERVRTTVEHYTNTSYWLFFLTVVLIVCVITTTIILYHLTRVRIRDYYKALSNIEESNEALREAKEKAEEKENIIEQQYAELQKTDKTLRKNNEALTKAIREFEVANAENIKSKERAEKNERLLKQQFAELQTSEEEIRANNEELMATTEALEESNTQLEVAKIRAEESDKLKTEFIHNMSHEIRTPMNGILGFTQMLSNPNFSEEKKNDFINVIQNCSRQLMRIIDDILEISKLGTKQVVTLENEVCLNNFLDELFSVFDVKAKESGLPFYLKKGLSDKESSIFTDAAKLNKILNNLIENAFKFTFKGFIEFGYRRKTVDGKKAIEIYVKDTGIGVEESKKELIFKRFTQEDSELSRKVGGLGLGLSISRENAKLIGGNITLETEKEKGSIFYLTIPYQPVYKGEKDESDNKACVDFDMDKTYNILVAEDEKVNYMYIENLLTSEFQIKCNLLYAKNGADAVNKCKTGIDLDIILMDLKMPIMNGFEASKLIREMMPDIPIIAQTAYTTFEDKENATKAGCNDFITKPIRSDYLYELLCKYLSLAENSTT